MTYRTKILDHTVSITSNSEGRYDVEIVGPTNLPTILRKHPKTFLTIPEAQAEAHAFAHATLQAPCECDGLEWSIVPAALTRRCR